jgi:hypothetical protein
VRTIQHCPFRHRGKTLLAATNQNKLEIVDASDMTCWHIHKLLDDPVYDNADFSSPDFLSKPFSLPVEAHHCDSISADAEGEHLILRMQDRFSVFHVDDRRIVGSVLFRGPARPRGHARFYMQNSPHDLAQKRYAELYPSRKAFV